jgi:hypothetical protein
MSLNISIAGGRPNRWNLAVCTKTEIAVVRALSDAEEEGYQKAVDSTTQFIHAQWPFRVLEQNYIDLEGFCRKTAQQFSQEKIRRYTDHLHIEMNRRISNYLASAGTFIELRESRHKRIYRKHKVGAEFLKLLAEIKADSFEVRFTLGLRNYAAHNNLPLGSLRFSGQTASDGTKVKLMIASFRKSALLEDRDWAEDLRTAIEIFDEEIDVLPMLGTALHRFVRIEELAMKSMAPLAVQDAEFILKLCSEIRNGEAYVIKPIEVSSARPRKWQIAANPLFPDRAQAILRIAQGRSS